MAFFRFRWLLPRLSAWLAGKALWSLVLGLGLVLSSMTWVHAPAAIAALNDDRYDGDIFALYAGNGALVPPKITFQEALKRPSPTLLVFYVDDSSDCKRYSTVLSQLQAFYGRVTDFILLRVDSLPLDQTTNKTDPAYYYTGVVPQTVVFDETGKVVFNQAGDLAFEQVDDVFRKVFELLPRSESVELKRRPVNEINTELVKS